MSRCADLWDQAARTRRLLLQTTDEATRLTLEKTIKDLEQRATRCRLETASARLTVAREFYASENGDTWFLSTDETGEPVVVHQANQPSGGARSELKVDKFLAVHRGHTPEHQALLRLVASVINHGDA